MSHVLGLDLGTSYIKCMLVDREGRRSEVTRRKTPKHQKGTLWTMSPDAFWKALKESVSEVLRISACDGKDLMGISYGSQTNSFILLDENLSPVSDIYIWSTMFSEEVDPETARLFGSPEFSQKTGIGSPSAALTIAKLKWIEKHQPSLWEKVRFIANLPDYLMLGLTGTLVSDTSSASLLGLLDIHSRSWWNPALELIGCEGHSFGTLREPGSICGQTLEGNPVGLRSGIPVISGALDHLVAAYGAGIGYLAPCSESTGTVLALMGLKPIIRTSPELVVGPALGGSYGHLAFYDYAAVAFEEYHDRFCPELPYDTMFSLAREIAIGCDRVTFDDSVDPHRPIETRFSSHPESVGQGVRAIMEAIATRLGCLITDVCQGEPLRSIVATGGGNRSAEFLRIKADMLFCQIITCTEKEFGAFGAAMIAACGIGWFKDIREVQERWIEVSERITPNLEAYRAYQSLGQVADE